ncbi:PREDICTED: manganese-dependent ADP-ribose/CDP-alcohol diphosphatase-like, partial [Nanorana parkeri]|uniref:manganese-dependent ADP-ribose/CDP-alcohol diphosphatase-like n=1 Tax=Nanorana parkeri TaxID=125878 RepID=UPI000854C601
MAEPGPESADRPEGAPPYFSFGVIGDVQHSTKPNGPGPWGTIRYFQQSLPHLQQAIEEWGREEPRPKFVLQLGDIIDRSNGRLGRSQEALDTVLKDIEEADIPFHHVWGNHELYNFDRDFLRQSKLNTSGMQDNPLGGGSHDEETSSPPDYYAYHFSPHSKFRVIVVDTYDLSLIGRKTDSQGYRDSIDFLERVEQENRGKDSNIHLVDFNGGLGSKQLSWLDKVLTYCDQHNERVIIAGHVPIHPKAKPSNCLAWNYKEILRVIESHGSVVCYFAGHDHGGGYHRDSHGIHHVTMEGVVESPPDSNAFGTLDVYEEGMVLRGRGRVKSRVLLHRGTRPACCCLPARPSTQGDGCIGQTFIVRTSALGPHVVIAPGFMVHACAINGTGNVLEGFGPSESG